MGSENRLGNGPVDRFRFERAEPQARPTLRMVLLQNSRLPSHVGASRLTLSTAQHGPRQCPRHIAPTCFVPLPSTPGLTTLNPSDRTAGLGHFLSVCRFEPSSSATARPAITAGREGAFGASSFPGYFFDRHFYCRLCILRSHNSGGDR